MNSNDFSRPEYEGEYDDNEDIPENHADDEDIE